MLQSASQITLSCLRHSAFTSQNFLCPAIDRCLVAKSMPLKKQMLLSTHKLQIVVINRTQLNPNRLCIHRLTFATSYAKKGDDSLLVQLSQQFSVMAQLQCITKHCQSLPVHHTVNPMLCDPNPVICDPSLKTHLPHSRLDAQTEAYFIFIKQLVNSLTECAY